jgi:ABC-type iron transport system FetAB permease component
MQSLSLSPLDFLLLLYLIFAVSCFHYLAVVVVSSLISRSLSSKRSLTIDVIACLPATVCQQLFVGFVIELIHNKMHNTISMCVYIYIYICIYTVYWMEELCQSSYLS